MWGCTTGVSELAKLGELRVVGEGAWRGWNCTVLHHITSSLYWQLQREREREKERERERETITGVYTYIYKLKGSWHKHRHRYQGLVVARNSQLLKTMRDGRDRAYHSMYYTMCEGVQLLGFQEECVWAVN